MESLKNLRLKLTPWIDGMYTFKYCDVELTLENADLEVGDKVADLWVAVAGVPGCELDERGLVAVDGKGAISLQQTVKKDKMIGFDKRVWRAERATEGDIVVSYRFLPRDVSDINRCYPIFDAIQEKNGALICGVTTIAAVEMANYHIYVSWDKSHMPEDAGVAAIRGVGDFDFVGTPMDYTFSLYMVGKIKSVVDVSGKRRVYWLDDHLPDEEKAITQLPPLLEVMCSFFKDKDLNYGIFFRKEPFEISNSGTAFEGGFAYGYSDKMPLVMETALSTLAHEIVHNWCRLEHATGEENWYSEGTAEFYSILVPLRSGIISEEQAAEWITDRCPNYYNNEYQNLTNLEAYEKAWEASEIQRVPYGRGFVYLAYIDYLLKQKGKESLDHLVLEIEDRRRSGKPYGTAVWEELIEKELGAEAVVEFREIMDGKKMIEPDDRWFDGKFTFQRGAYGDVKRGTVENALIWSRRGQ